MLLNPRTHKKSTHIFIATRFFKRIESQNAYGVQGRYFCSIHRNHHQLDLVITDHLPVGPHCIYHEKEIVDRGE